ncbi:MAG TPA: phytoene desaturase family protein [Ktedonobacteraceae bacterium]|nr:phytoene desaturase family protein [Ktedonobacteraceae bacterium]
MYSYSHPTALVIGAGLGGIVTAARLAQAGFSVKVVEKQETSGGRCSQLIRDGHRFDIGATLFLMPEVFTETYAALGQNMEDHLELHRIDPTYRIRFEDRTEIALTSDLNTMESQLEAIEPGSFGGLLRYLVEGYQSYHLCLQRFVGRNFYHLTDYFSVQNLPLLIKLKALVKHYDNIGHFVHDPHLKAAFTFQNMYLGLSPFDAPATYSLVQYTELAEGVWYPIGGIYRVIESLTRVAENYGVNFVYNTPVKHIEVAGNRATGVVLEDDSRIYADVVIANADLPYVYSHLLPESAEAHRLERLKYTCSAIMFYWGVDKVYPQLETHNVFLADDYRTSFDRIFNDHLLPDKPSFYVHAPARTDPSAAPLGQDTLMVLVPAGHLDTHTTQDWDLLQARARSAVIHRLAASTGMVDLEQHLKYEVSYTPRDWLNLFNLAKGAAFGLSHNFMQVGYLRPHNRHHTYRNLYFVGSSTHPGTGLPMVLLSARLTTERILKENSVPNLVLRLKPAVAV